MTYYDHGTALAFKLDRWSEERHLRNYELEATASEQRALSIRAKQEYFFKQLVNIIRCGIELNHTGATTEPEKSAEVRMDPKN